MKKSILIVTILMMSSCATFTVTKESLASQLQENQNISKERNVSSLGVEYFSNNLKKIKCTNKSGKEVWLYSGKNMNFKITKITTNENLGMYFDTVILQNDTLYGLKSRILGGKRKVAVKDIAKIEINVEEPRTEEIK